MNHFCWIFDHEPRKCRTHIIKYSSALGGITQEEQDSSLSFLYTSTDNFHHQSWEYVSPENTMTASALFSSPSSPWLRETIFQLSISTHGSIKQAQKIFRHKIVTLLKDPQFNRRYWTVSFALGFLATLTDNVNINPAIMQQIIRKLSEKSDFYDNLFATFRIVLTIPVLLKNTLVWITFCCLFHFLAF